MELILNDLSLHGQFTDLDDFEDYFIENLFKLINHMIDRKIPLLKKSDTYSRQITNDVTLEQYLRESCNRPTATLIKERIIDMAYHEPYWDDMDQMQSRTDVDYRYPDID